MPTQSPPDQIALRLDLSESFTTDNYSIQTIDLPAPDNKTGKTSISKHTGVFTDSMNMFRTQQKDIYQNTGAVETELSPGEVRNQKILVFNTEAQSWSTEPLLGAYFIPPRHGSLISVAKERLGFWIGGIADTRDLGTQSSSLNILRRFNMASRTWTIEETPFRTVLYGSTVFLDLSERGILLHLAGQNYRGASELKVELNSFGAVQIYDIASHRWYQQRTSGDERIRNTTIISAINSGGIPHGRLSPCVVAIRPSDNSRSRYHIYMLGGSWDGTVFDEVWVLSVPSFRWTLLRQGSPMPSVSECHLVGKTQLFILAGRSIRNQSLSSNCASGPIQIFDLNNLDWVNAYSPSSKDYNSTDILLQATQQDIPDEGFSSSFIGSLLYIPPIPSSLKSRQTPRNSSISTEPNISRTSTSLKLGNLTSSTIPTVDQISTQSTQAPTFVSTYPSTAQTASSLTSNALHAQTTYTEWQSMTRIPTNPDGAKSILENPVVTTGSSPSTSTKSRIHLVGTNIAKTFNTSTTALTSKTLKMQTWNTMISSIKPTQIHNEPITVISTVQLPRMTVTMHMTISNTETKTYKTATTSHKRKALSSRSIYGSSLSTTGLEPSTKVTETSAPTAGTTATDEDDTLSPPSTNLKPYQNSTGIIAGSIIGGLGMIGSAAIILIIYCCRAQHQRKKKRNSMSEDLLDSVPQKRGLHSVEIQNLPPVVTRNRKSRMDWVRFSKARGLHEVFELEG
ncbi:hypothetical protein TWF788_005930 [Orbilia oligospora]|uniref:Uncharacterized protein n=1 Tax=Orbilia oligospora TaxID=2813651 RepID=A0A7C8TVJ5_ORBOL|nr:hypothetical protein TWF788_005930 [Orbilia oligospora]